MLTSIITAMKTSIYRVTTAILNLFWTASYFVYFLIREKPEWKCEFLRAKVQKICCVNNNLGGDVTSNGGIQNYAGKFVRGNDQHSGYPKTSQLFYVGRTYMEKIAEIASYNTKTIASCLHYLIDKVYHFFKNLVYYITVLLKSLFLPTTPFKSLPATSKPLKEKQDASFHNEINSYNEEEDEEIPIAIQHDKSSIYEKGQIQEEFSPRSTPLEPTSTSEQVSLASAPISGNDNNICPIPINGEFYSQQVYRQGQEATPCQDFRELSYPPPAPAPPPAKPITIPTSIKTDTNRIASSEAKMEVVKGGVTTLPPDVLAELHGIQRMRQDRGSPSQREMSQSCHPDMVQWKSSTVDGDKFDRSITTTPWRACSVGPTMRKLEQVVSRLEDLNDNEAQYVFRSKGNVESDNSYYMGRSVFTPLDEAEQMRESINRKSVYHSRPVTPVPSLQSGTHTPHEQDRYGSPARPYQQYRDDDAVRRRARTVGPQTRKPSTSNSASHTVSNSYIPFNLQTTQHLDHNQSTIENGLKYPYEKEGVMQGSVSNQVRQWPPASNASKVEVIKDSWINHMLDGKDNELITTKCKRVIETKTEDKWKFLDEAGQLVDEVNQISWKGKLDTVLRDGPGQGRHWSRTVEMLPTGDTLFQDVTRQYNSSYVVESVIRNY